MATVARREGRHPADVQDDRDELYAVMAVRNGADALCSGFMAGYLIAENGQLVLAPHLAPASTGVPAPAGPVGRRRAGAERDADAPADPGPHADRSGTDASRADEQAGSSARPTCAGTRADVADACSTG